jgi:septal ring factor EnvC (AmiA/AmiB activator)
MLPNVYEIDRLARELPKARLNEAANARRVHEAREAAAHRAGNEGGSAAATPGRASILSSKLLQLLRG